MMHAVILAAGQGSRLRPLTADRPKALVPLGDVPIIGRALDALREAGVKRATVVVGYCHDALTAYLDARGDADLEVVENPAWATTNTLASLATAAHLVSDDFLLVDGDLVFEPAVVSRLSGPGTRLAVDAATPLDDDAVKVVAEGDHIVAVGKQVDGWWPPAGESIGLAKIDGATADRLFVTARRLLDAGGASLYYEAAFESLIADGEVLELADVTGLRWVEIDDHADLARARARFVGPESPSRHGAPAVHGSR